MKLPVLFGGGGEGRGAVVRERALHNFTAFNLLFSSKYIRTFLVAFYGSILQKSSWQVQRKGIFKEKPAQSIVGNDMEG